MTLEGSIVAVDDHGIEVLKKAGEQVVPGNKSDHYIKVGGIPFSSSNFIPPISTDEHYLNIARGLIPNHSVQNRFGFSNDIVTSEFRDLWSGGIPYVFATTAETLSVVSTDVNDTAAGTGAQNVAIFGLDNGFNVISELVPLDGTTPVITTNLFLRVNGMFVLAAGSSVFNQGIITATQSSSAILMGHMDIGLNEASHIMFTVPAAFSLAIYDLQIGTVSGKGVLSRLVIQPGGFATRVPRQFIHNDNINIVLTAPTLLPEKTSVTVQGQSEQGEISMHVFLDSILIGDNS